MTLAAQIVWLFVLALPVACIAWTVTHEEIFRGPREYCVRQSEHSPSPLCRKLFYLFQCEYCFSLYVAALIVGITGYHLLFDDCCGLVIGGRARVCIVVPNMSSSVLLIM